MSKQMGRPKVLTEDLVRVETQIPWEDEATLNTLVAMSGVSRASLLRLFVSTGVQTYMETLLDLRTTAARPQPRDSR